jgi:hypothetical protein
MEDKQVLEGLEPAREESQEVVVTLLPAPAEVEGARRRDHMRKEGQHARPTASPLDFVEAPHEEEVEARERRKQWGYGFKHRSRVVLLLMSVDAEREHVR